MLYDTNEINNKLKLILKDTFSFVQSNFYRISNEYFV